MKQYGYDVIIRLTLGSPDDPNKILNGPLSGGFCETFAIFEKLANEFGGRWVDWEPNRCTYMFKDEEGWSKFYQRLEDGPESDDRMVLFEKCMYLNVSDEDFESIDMLTFYKCLLDDPLGSDYPVAIDFDDLVLTWAYGGNIPWMLVSNCTAKELDRALEESKVLCSKRYAEVWSSDETPIEEQYDSETIKTFFFTSKNNPYWNFSIFVINDGTDEIYDLFRKLENRNDTI